jgi:predicted ArsR family transcriptional regulator
MDPILVAERIFTAITTQAHALPDKADLAEDLRNLADWLEKDGFIPFVDASTGIAPR